MKIQNINSNNSAQQKMGKNLSFEHTIRVSICTKQAESACYNFVKPNQDLYQFLNSKLVRILNKDFLTNLKKQFGIPLKSKKEPNLIETKLVNDLKLLDSDYNTFNTVRAAYRRNQIPYLVTGKDEAIVESILNAKSFGQLKRDSILLSGNSKSNNIMEFGRGFKSKEIDFVTNPINYLRSNDGKEIIIRANFLENTSKNGTKKYSLESYHFCEVESSQQLTEAQKEMKQRKSRIDVSSILKSNIEYKLSKYIKHKSLRTDEYNKVINSQTHGDTRVSNPEIIKGNKYPEFISNFTQPS